MIKTVFLIFKKIDPQKSKNAKKKGAKHPVAL
jgi:hypothetical protein